MAKKPRTTSEHLISIYGYITGLKREVSNIKNNHLKHLHEDVDKLHGKVDKLLYVILGEDRDWETYPHLHVNV